MPSTRASKQTLLLSLLCLFTANAFSLAPYQKVGRLSGQITSIGSDTLSEPMSTWSEMFHEHYPGVRFEIQAQGSSTAPPALIEGTASIGPMSRPMKAKEIATFREHFGYPPLAVPVGIDAIGIVVSKENPLKALTTKQLDAIFSQSRRCGGETPLHHWRDFALKGKIGEQDIVLYGRNSASGTYAYFKKKGLCLGDFLASVNEQPGNSAVVQAVESDPFGIGYTSVGYSTSGVRLLSIDGIFPTAKNIGSGKYPLARVLYIYVNKAPSSPLDKTTKEFLKFVVSKEGQALIQKAGFMPISDNLSKKALRSLQ